MHRMLSRVLLVLLSIAVFSQQARAERPPTRSRLAPDANDDQPASVPHEPPATSDEDEVINEIFGELPSGVESAASSRSRTATGPRSTGKSAPKSGETDAAARVLVSTAVKDQTGGDNSSQEVLDDIFSSVTGSNGGSAERVRQTSGANAAGVTPVSFSEVLREMAKELQNSGMNARLSEAVKELKAQFGSLSNADFSNLDVQSFMADFLSRNGLERPGSNVPKDEPEGLPTGTGTHPLGPVQPPTLPMDADTSKRMGAMMDTLIDSMQSMGLGNSETLEQLTKARDQLLAGNGLQLDSGTQSDLQSLFSSAFENAGSGSGDGDSVFARMLGVFQQGSNGNEGGLFSSFFGGPDAGSSSSGGSGAAEGMRRFFGLLTGSGNGEESAASSGLSSFLNAFGGSPSSEAGSSPDGVATDAGLAIRHGPFPSRLRFRRF